MISICIFASENLQQKEVTAGEEETAQGVYLFFKNANSARGKHQQYVETSLNMRLNFRNEIYLTLYARVPQLPNRACYQATASSSCPSAPI